MADRAIYDVFRRSENIEDRRRRPVLPEISTGPFAAGQLVPNVFDVHQGLMLGLDPFQDFYPAPLSQLARDAGIDSLPALQSYGPLSALQNLRRGP